MILHEYLNTTQSTVKLNLGDSHTIKDEKGKEKEANQSQNEIHEFKKT